MDKLTTEQIDAKCAELKIKYDSDITPLVFTDKKTGEQVIGYLKEIDDYNVTMYAVGKYLANNIEEGCEAVLNACLIKEESSVRILSTDKKDIKIRVGAVLACIPLIEMYANEYKKK